MPILQTRSTALQAPLALALLVLLSGCCETRGELTCSTGGVVARPLASSCGYGYHYRELDEPVRPAYLVLALDTEDARLKVRTSLRPKPSFGDRVYTLPAPGSSNADVPRFELSLPPGLPAYASGQLRLDANFGTSRKGTLDLTLTDGSTCKVDFEVCSDDGLNIGEPPPSPSSGDSDHDWDWDD